MITWLKERQVSIPVHHVSNSAGIVDLPEYNKDIVRAGIILYGLWPSDEVNKENIDLQPLLSLKSHVVHVKELEPGRIISYGGTFEVEHPMRIATVPGRICGRLSAQPVQSGLCADSWQTCSNLWKSLHGSDDGGCDRYCRCMSGR